MFGKIFKFILRHKFITTIILVIVAYGGYKGYQSFKSGQVTPQYVLSAVESGTLVVSVDGSGQVSASNQVDLKPKVSGDVFYVGVTSGQEVKQGQLLFQLDARDAQKTVRDAENSLASTKLALEKLKQPIEPLTLLQAEHAVSQAQESKQGAEEDLAKSYEDGFNTVANAFLDLPAIMSGLDSMLFNNTFEQYQQNIDWYANQTSVNNRIKAESYKDGINTDYATVRQRFNSNFEHYKTLSRSSSLTAIEDIILESYETTKQIADLVKSSNNFLDFVQDDMEQSNIAIPATVSTHQTLLDSYTSKTNSHLLNLMAIKRTIADSKTAIVNASRSIEEKTESLANLRAGADPLDIKTQELSLTQRENALADAKEKLADYFIRAPFAGVVSSVSVKKGDPASSGTILATLVTKQHVAEISLNEIDATKIKLGQKVTLTFDAVEGLSVAGDVLAIDTIGTVTQGVVSYNVKIGFETPDGQVKPGMSVSAAIIINAKINVLLVPNAAVKQQGDSSYVEIMQGANTTPQQRNVEVGLSNDTMTEIISGLNEGDKVVEQTIVSSAATTMTSQSSGLRIPGITGGGGGGGFRN